MMQAAAQHAAWLGSHSIAARAEAGAAAAGSSSSSRSKQGTSYVAVRVWHSVVMVRMSLAPLQVSPAVPYTLQEPVLRTCSLISEASLLATADLSFSAATLCCRFFSSPCPCVMAPSIPSANAIYDKLRSCSGMHRLPMIAAAAENWSALLESSHVIMQGP